MIKYSHNARGTCATITFSDGNYAYEDIQALIKSNLLGKVFEKAISETAKKLATKGAVKAAEQKASKTGQAIGGKVWVRVRDTGKFAKTTDPKDTYRQFDDNITMSNFFGST